MVTENNIVPDTSFDIVRYINRTAYRAMPLWDRPGIYLSSDPEMDDELFNKRKNRWIAILGNEALLEKRLKCSDHSIEDLSFNGVDFGATRVQHEWCETFAKVLSIYRSQNFSASIPLKPLADCSQPLPFEEILYPFVLHFREKVSEDAGHCFSVFSKQAQTLLEDQLLAHLSFISGLSLGVEFYQFRFRMAPASSIESIWTKQEPSFVIYEAFVKHMLHDGMLSFLERYPVLARLLCQSTDQFIRSIAVFCQRFFKDFIELKKTFGWQVSNASTAIRSIRTDLSDRHHGGQTVFECTMSTGESIIYKPRSIKPELTFYNFLEYFNTLSLPLELKTISGVDRAHYGWVEKVNATICMDEKAVERFYTRAGILLAVLHVLSVTDVHFENLMADGEYPMVVDLETILDTFIDQGKSVRTKPGNTVLRTGLLPRWQKAAGGRRFDMSGLGADEFQDSGIKVMGWKFVNTDQMQLEEDTRTKVSLHHRTGTTGKLTSVFEYLHAFMEGFKQGYFSLMENRDRLLMNTELLKQFDGLKLRTIVRDTNTYAGIHLHLLHPEYLKDGIDRSIELEWLARPLMGTASPRKNRSMLYEVERTAMEQLDIPHFDTSVAWNADEDYRDEDFVFFNRKRDSNLIRENLVRLSLRDFNKQKKLIEKSVRARFESKKGN